MQTKQTRPYTVTWTHKRLGLTVTVEVPEAYDTTDARGRAMGIRDKLLGPHWGMSWTNDFDRVIKAKEAGDADARRRER